MKMQRLIASLPTPSHEIVHSRSQDLIDWAVDFGHYAHCERTPDGIPQTRKFSKEPYMVHPIRVATMLHEEGFGVDMICAALLHDVLEDTDVTFAELASPALGFGYNIATLVLQVTDVSKPEDGNRAVRKSIDRQYVAGGSRAAHIIKYADLIDNTQDIVAQDRNFAKLYLTEKMLLINEMKRTTGAMPMYELALAAWNRGMEAIHAKPA